MMCRLPLGDPTAFDFSPDGKEIVFARNTDKVEATSTNNDLFTVPHGGEAKRITGTNPGRDTTPRYSPDGRWIAYRSQARNGYESDRFRLMLYDRQAGTIEGISTGFDRWVDELVWAPDSQQIFVVRKSAGASRSSLPQSMAGSSRSSLTDEQRALRFQVRPTLAFTRSSLEMPAEVFKANADGAGAMQLTQPNAT